MITGDPPPDDDLSIGDDALLLRRIHPKNMHPTDTGGSRPASNSIEDIRDRDTGVIAMSVLVLPKVLALGGSVEDVMAHWPGFGLIAIPALACRECDLRLVWAPSPNEGILSDAHAHVFGKKTGSVQKKLLAAAQILFWPVPTD